MSANSKLNFTRTTAQGTFWMYSSFYGGKLLVLISTIILARLLSKEDFGIVGFALVVISFLNVLKDLGIGPALIYHRDDPEAADTAFWLGLVIGLALFALTWFIAPLAGTFFNDSRAIPVTRVLGLTFPISAFGNVHNALLQKNLAFKQKFIPDVSKMGSKGITSIVLALLSFGAWSLVFGQLVGAVVLVVAYWRTLPWRPAARFSRRLMYPLLSYGVSIVLLNAVAILLSNADYLFVGRFFGAAALGVYTLAFRLPEMLIIQFCTVVGKVLFPVYTKMRDDAEALRQAFLTTMHYVSLVTIPLGLGLALVSEPLVLTVFTAKWVEAIPVMQAISIYALLFSLAYNAGSVYKAQGRPMLLTKLAVVRAIILIPALWWAAAGPGTIAAIGWTHAAVALAAGSLNLAVASRMVGASFTEIAAALRPAVISGSLMAVVVAGALLGTASAPPPVQLITAVAIGALAYGVALWWLQQQLIIQLGQTLRSALIRR